MQPDDLRAIMQFHADANTVILDTAAQLSAEEFTRAASPSHGSVRQLLIHILGGDVYFLAACQGAPVPDMAALEGLTTLDALRAQFAASAAATDTFLSSVSAAELARDVTLTFGDHTLTLPMWQVFMQQFSHAHMHRGELSIVLSQLGHPLPTIDLLVHFVTTSGQHWPFG